MGTLIYTAKRSLVGSHIVNQDYQLDIGITAAPRSRKAEKSEVRARGGATETLYHRADTEWSITFEPVNGVELDNLVEFLDSTESGEPFDMQLYGTESAFTSVMRSDERYELTPFMPVGSERGDWFQVSISVRAV